MFPFLFIIRIETFFWIHQKVESMSSVHSTNGSVWLSVVNILVLFLFRFFFVRIFVYKTTMHQFAFGTKVYWPWLQRLFVILLNFIKLSWFPECHSQCRLKYKHWNSFQLIQLDEIESWWLSKTPTSPVTEIKREHKCFYTFNIPIRTIFFHFANLSQKQWSNELREAKSCDNIHKEDYAMIRKHAFQVSYFSLCSLSQLSLLNSNDSRRGHSVFRIMIVMD